MSRTDKDVPLWVKAKTPRLYQLTIDHVCEEHTKTNDWFRMPGHSCDAGTKHAICSPVTENRFWYKQYYTLPDGIEHDMTHKPERTRARVTLREAVKEYNAGDIDVDGYDYPNFQYRRSAWWHFL